MSSIVVQAAVHSHLGNQTSVRASVVNPGAAIAKGTVRLEFYKFFPVPMNPGVGKETGLGLGEVPAWVKSKYPTYLAPEEAAQYQSTIDSFRSSSTFRQAQQSGADFSGLLSKMPDGFILPRKVAEEFSNAAIPAGESIFFFAHVFTGVPDPWDFLRIALLDQQGKEILASFYQPG